VFIKAGPSVVWSRNSCRALSDVFESPAGKHDGFFIGGDARSLFRREQEVFGSATEIPRGFEKRSQFPRDGCRLSAVAREQSFGHGGTQ
jgi:hypothetical protein